MTNFFKCCLYNKINFEIVIKIKFEFFTNKITFTIVQTKKNGFRQKCLLYILKLAAVYNIKPTFAINIKTHLRKYLFAFITPN